MFKKAMFKKVYYLLLFLLLLPGAVVADVVTLNPDRPDQYVVKKGDTLWDISAHFLQDPFLWKEVWGYNPQIENPHLIYPGDVVSLVLKDGKLRLVVNAAESDADSADSADSAQREADRHVKLSPKIRSLGREGGDVSKSISFDAIQYFLAQALVVEEGEMDAWPYVAESYEQHLIFGTGDKVYIRNLNERTTNIHYAVYRQGPAYIDDNVNGSKKLLGYQAIYIGDVVIERHGDPATAIISSTQQEMFKGDRLIAKPDEFVLSKFVLSSPEQEIDADILSVINGVTQIGRYQTVAIDVGRPAGVEVGSILGIYQSGKIAEDRFASDLGKLSAVQRIVLENENESVFNKELSNLLNGIRGLKIEFDHSDLVSYLGAPSVQSESIVLPDEYVGLLMVYRVFERISYGLVLKILQPIHVQDSVKNL